MTRFVVPCAWVTDGTGVGRQVFKGWVLATAWTDSELYVVQGSAGLRGNLWNVPLDGRVPTRIAATNSIVLMNQFFGIPNLHMDAHPGGQRLAITAQEFNESDIVLVENIR